MNISEQVVEVLNEVAAKLGVAAEYLYPILLRQARIDGVMGIINIFGYLLAVFAFVFLVTYVIKKMLKSEEEGEEVAFLFSAALVFSGLFCLFSVVAFFIELSNLKTYVTALLNPDWYILEKLLQQIAKL